MPSIYYNCGNGLTFELRELEDKTWWLAITYSEQVVLSGQEKTLTQNITIPFPTTEARDQMLKEIQQFAETTIIRLRNAKDEV